MEGEQIEEEKDEEEVECNPEVASLSEMKYILIL